MPTELEYFPSPAYKRSVLRIRSLLAKEIARLESIAQKKGRASAIGKDNLGEELPRIRAFCREYHKAFMRYLDATLPQHKNGVQCKAGCGNCCHHFPMSVEPFELVEFYANIRKSPDLILYLEECVFRTRTYYALLKSGEVRGEEDPEDFALVSYFKKTLACPFIRADGDCGTYSCRPVTCRMYFSETSGEFCVPEYLQTEKNRSFIVYLPDDVEWMIADLSAHYQELALPESLYEGILSMNTLEPFFANADSQGGVV
ncbi:MULTISPECIES: YkgJ family cysteine cluster protein [Fibrobacter]|uniref:YkgJ family cysteine cluster protein n=1 Tax=Fibrobacter TaxID=832 RepID=UPI000BC812B8|nr:MULTISPECIES: YkgJ family cysteine cluster protein [Fibrobacter]PBC68114.1 putative zinc- or iron-chelating protein [Fibrobacter sp. UWS1]